MTLSEKYIPYQISHKSDSIRTMHVNIWNSFLYSPQAAFLLPIITGLIKEGLASSSFSETQEPQSIIVSPTRELAIQIYMEARKFAHSTMLRPCVAYGGTSVGHQLRQIGQGCNILVATPGRLMDFINRGKVSVTGAIVCHHATSMCGVWGY